MARFAVLFDTNVLFGFHLNDVILAMAERGLFRPLWSDQILTELSDNLIEHGIPRVKVEKRISAMQRSFPDAIVQGYEDLVASMINDPKDRHVLAACVRANCEVIVTFNLKDFPECCVAAYDIEVVHPDHFLLDQLDLYPGPTLAVLRQLVTDYSHPTLHVEELVVRLAEAGVPDFASAVRRYL